MRPLLWIHVDSPSLHLTLYASWCLFIPFNVSLCITVSQSSFVSLPICQPLCVSLSNSLTFSVSVSPQLSAFLSVSSSPHLRLSVSERLNGTQWDSQSQHHLSKGVSINRPISTHERTGHSDAHAKTDAHKTVMWRHTPTSTFTHSQSQDI